MKGRVLSVKKILALLLCVVLACGVLVGCSNISSKVIGDWEYSTAYISFVGKMAADGEAEQLKEAFSKVKLHLNEDGTYLLDYGVTNADGASSESGTYTVNEKEKTITLFQEDGGSDTYIIYERDGGAISLKNDQYSDDIYFKPKG